MVEDTQSITFRLPVPLYRRLKAAAFATDTAMNTLVIEGLEMRLGKEPAMRIGTTTSQGGLYEVSILVGGMPQILYRAPDGQLYVAGRAGEPCTIRVRNMDPRRIEVIPSVDGRNMLKDEPASFSESSGLVIPGYGSYDFTGFRQNDHEVSAFIFADPSRSVAAQAGAPANIGVIGLAAYRERVPEYTPEPFYKPFYGSLTTRGDSYGGGSKGMSFGHEVRSFNSSADPTSDCAPVAVASPGPAASGGPDLGMGMGETIADHVGHTSFTRTGSPVVLEIRYATVENLRARGIITDDHQPQAFPESPTGYAGYDRVR